MSRLRHLLIGGALGALAIGAIGAPVGAADTTGTLAIVNGIPGRTVDVCLNGNEIKSNLKYGKAVLKSVVGVGDKSLKVYAADPRRCKGSKLAQKGFSLLAGQDLTIVATKEAPKVVVFDNAGLGEIPPAGAPVGFSWFAWRHAAELPANFKYSFAFPEAPVGPTADPIWVKGDEVTSSGTPGFGYRLRATRPERSKTIAVKGVTFQSERRYEWILVGSNPDNARFAFIARVVSAPSL